ncbi:hypothetical protein FD755_004179 [Muntiacus reevesi]|uniref:Cadherin Y-type LIR-motif domain-containing protein n=1 Tax=Muntiacus reevesi TaxID=9886 RepID=A0A5J5MRZ8_MUNRE|nr:hypothetical protein FD755_004179 [Muntiacus reevesi]
MGWVYVYRQIWVLSQVGGPQLYRSCIRGSGCSLEPPRALFCEMCLGAPRYTCGQQVWAPVDLCGTHDPEGNPGYPPHIYAEEGECEQADSLSSLTCSEHDLPPDLLDSLGPKAAPLEEIYSESAFRSPQNAYFH